MLDIFSGDGEREIYRLLAGSAEFIVPICTSSVANALPGERFAEQDERTCKENKRAKLDSPHPNKPPVRIIPQDRVYINEALLSPQGVTFIGKDAEGGRQNTSPTTSFIAHSGSLLARPFKGRIPSMVSKCCVDATACETRSLFVRGQSIHELREFPSEIFRPLELTAKPIPCLTNPIGERTRAGGLYNSNILNIGSNGVETSEESSNFAVKS